jgi:hypothetical protein
MPNSWLTRGIGQQRRIRERRGWTLTQRTDNGARSRRHRNGKELACGRERIFAGPKSLDEPVDEGQPSPGVPLLAQGSQGDVTDVPGENVRLVGRVDHSPMNIKVRETSQALLKRPRDQTLVQALEKAFIPISHLMQLARPGGHIRRNRSSSKNPASEGSRPAGEANQSGSTLLLENVVARNIGDDAVVGAVVQHGEMQSLEDDPASRRQRRVDIAAAAAWGVYWIGVCAWVFQLSTQGEPKNWLWVAPALIAVGPTCALLLLTPWFRRRAVATGMVLSALVLTVVTTIGLMQGEPSLQVWLFVGLVGPAWGLWVVHRVREREAEAVRVEERRLAQERHDEILKAIRARRWTGRRGAGHRR